MNAILLTLALIFSSNPLSQNGDTAAAKNTDVVVLADDLISAIRDIDIVSVNLLLAEGAYVDSVDTKGNTPLMTASKIGNPRIVRILLAHDPNINAKNLDGETALMIAAKNGQYHIAQQLVVRGANLNDQNSEGFTAKDLALRNGQSQVAELLDSGYAGLSAR